jgi:FAD/FMN-containing dehydrogenase
MLRGCGEAKAIAEPLGQPLAAASPRVAPKPPRNSLAEIVGESQVAQLEKSVLVSPGSIEELSEVVRFSSKVLPAGGMTWLPNTTDLIVSTSRLNQIIEHEPADLIAVAHAGVKLTDFNAKLAENGQWLPLDPPDDGRATLGGVVATGLGGAQQFGYGRPRGTVIGMKVVLADGSVIKAGGRVVKNVAGYDLCKLFTGSYGTLGIIAELNFKLRPRPECESTVVLDGLLFDLPAKARSIISAGLFPVAAEIVSPAFAAMLSIATKQPLLLVRFAGNEVAVKYQIERTLALSDGGEVVTEDTELWKQVAAAPLQHAFGWRTSVLPSDLAALTKLLDIAGAVWQIGAADGRVMMLDNTVCKPLINHENRSADMLMDRIKQQLDPSNVFLTLGQHHEHSS